MSSPLITLKELQDIIDNKSIIQFTFKNYKSKIQDEFKDWEKDSWKHLIYYTLYFLFPDSVVTIFRNIKDFLKACIFETWERFNNLCKYKVFIPNHYGYSTCDVLIEKAIPMLILHKQQYIEDQYPGIPAWLDKSELENKELSKDDILEITKYLNNHHLDISDRHAKFLTKIWIDILDEMIKGLKSKDILINMKAEKKFWKYGSRLWI